MKTIFALSALAILATAPAHAAVKGCWQASGNWNGGTSFTNCEGINDGHQSPDFIDRTPPKDDDQEETSAVY